MYSVEIVIKYAILTSTTICNFTFDVMFQGNLASEMSDNVFHVKMHY